MNGICSEIFISESTDPYDNLAMEELLMEFCQAEDPKNRSVILFLWQNDNTIVIGRNQNVWEECSVSDFLADGGRIARRKSGGGAVYHDTGNLNFSFIAPKDLYDISRQLGVIAKAVGSFGISAEVSGRNDLVIGEGDAAVRQSPSAGNALSFVGRKFSGNAFYDNGKRKLHHGTILIDTNPAKISKYLTPNHRKLAKRSIRSAASRVVCLKEICADITGEKMKAAVINAFMEEYGQAGVKRIGAGLGAAGRKPVNEESGKAGPELIDAESGTAAPRLFREFGRFSGFYASPDWIFGAERGFDNTAELETDDGIISIHYSVCDGIITDAVIFTDSMDWECAEKMRGRVIGKMPGQLAGRKADSLTD